MALWISLMLASIDIRIGNAVLQAEKGGGREIARLPETNQKSRREAADGNGTMCPGRPFPAGPERTGGDL